MRDFADVLKRSLFSENPLLVSVLGLSGAVVFTRNVVSALTAAVTALLVLTAASAAMHIFECFIGVSGSDIVFFSTAAAMTAICGVLTEILVPAVWTEIGACYPLFAVGSLAIVTSSRKDGAVIRREAETLLLVAGYGTAIVVVAAVRQVFGWMPIMAASGGALIIIGIAAAVLRAVLSHFGEVGDGVNAMPGADANTVLTVEESGCLSGDDDITEMIEADGLFDDTANADVAGWTEADLIAFLELDAEDTEDDY